MTDAVPLDVLSAGGRGERVRPEAVAVGPWLWVDAVPPAVCGSFDLAAAEVTSEKDVRSR